MHSNGLRPPSDDRGYELTWLQHTAHTDYVDRYNFRRLHSSLDYETPAEWYFSGINSMNAPIEKMRKWAA